MEAEGSIGVVLQNAVQLNATNGLSNGPVVATEVSIKSEDLIDVFIARLDVSRGPVPTEEVAASPVPASTPWKTDTDISGRAQVKERVLQAWQPPQDDQGFSIEDDIVSTAKNGVPGKKWDQFAANEKLFGVKSQWDEDVYTHKLDTNRPDFAKRQAEAEKLAREIEQSSSTNAHVLEERGVAVNDSGLTEEDKYSGVQRNPNAWIPPARRPVANLPTPRAVPADPAIISSQLAKPSQGGHKTAASVTNTPRQVPKEAPKASEATTASASKAPNPIEADIMAKFRQFATNERDRLSVKKASTFRKEKDGRLQDLLAFSKDFKLNTPVPEDLIPILAKDKAKQEAIVQKAASSANSSPVAVKSSTASIKSSETKPSDTLRARVDRAHQMPTPLPAPSPLTKEQSAEIKKLKPSAVEFKPFNPAASSFTPTHVQRNPTAASPVLSTSSSQPRQAPFSVEAASFFPRKPKPPAERSPILEHFDPFKTFAAKNPDSTSDIETPLKVDPAWPSENTASILDPPQDSRRPPNLEEQYTATPQQFAPGPTPQMMFVGSMPQSHAFQQQQAFYAGKGQQYMSGPPGQFAPFQNGSGFVPPQYMYQGVQGYGRAMQPQMIPMPYQTQQFNNYNQPSKYIDSAWMRTEG